MVFKRDTDYFLPLKILSDKEISLITQEEGPIWYSADFC